jgi:hypothetical protein
MFFVLTRIKFPLTSFPYCYQTWENEENKFQELVFLETNATLMCMTIVISFSFGFVKV